SFNCTRNAAPTGVSRLRPRCTPIAAATRFSHAGCARPPSPAVRRIPTAEYVAQTRTLAAAEGDRRAELLNLLLTGYDEAGGRVARLLKEAGYLEKRYSYCAAAVRSTDPSEMERPGRTQRIVAAVTHAVPADAIRTLAGVRSIASAMRRQSGWA